MTANFVPKGAWTALATPFLADGAFDARSYARLLEFQLAAGIHGLVPCGTTGESATLSWEEHGSAVGLTVRYAQGRCGVLAGTGSNSTQEAIDGARDAWARGANAILMVDCYYNGPSSLELRTEYYERVLQAVPEVPLVPYIIPGRTGCALSAADLAVLHLENPERVPAVKQATGDLDRMKADRAAAGEGLAILSGDDELTLAMMADEGIKASGVVSVMSNIAPAAVRAMFDAQLAGDASRAAAVAASLAPLFAAMTVNVVGERVLPDGRHIAAPDRFRNPVPVKTMMAGLGMLQPCFRAPLGLMTKQAVDICRQALRTVWAQSPEVLSPIEAAFDVSVERRIEDDSVWAPLARR